MPKNSLWYLDTDGTTAKTNTGFEARRLLRQANNDNDGGGVGGGGGGSKRY